MGGEDGQRPDPASPAAPGHSPAGPPAPKRINGGTPPPGNTPEAAGLGRGAEMSPISPIVGSHLRLNPGQGAPSIPGEVGRHPGFPPPRSRGPAATHGAGARRHGSVRAPPRVCVCVSPSRQSGSCTARSTDPFTMPKTHPAWQEGKLRPAAQICIGLVPNEPWDITAGISQQAGSPRAGVRMGGTPGRGCQKPHQAQPGQGKELIPLLAGSQMATAPIPQLSRFKR